MAATATWMVTLPSVGDAGARVARLLAEHGGHPITAPPPPRLAASLVAAEDQYFYSDILVNVAEGAGRAGLALLRHRGDPGGSTIPQQLAKQLWPQHPGFVGVADDVGIGVKLGLRYSKPTILAMYLNAVYFGNGYWGVDAAAEGYFGRPPARLDWAQASLLAGLPQAPSAYDPFRDLPLAKRRQRYVLDQLVSTGRLTAAQARRAYAAPLDLRVAG